MGRIKVVSKESADLTPLLTGQQNRFKREDELLFHYPHYGQGPSQKPQSALISNDWKLLKDWETDSYKLFNLKTDLSEQNDLSSKEPDRFETMTAAMNKRLTEVDAQLLSENPDYNPNSQSGRRNRQNR